MKFIRTLTYSVMILISAASVVLGDINSQDLYEQGIEAFKSGNYGSSRLIFRKIIDNDDEYRDKAWYHLALSIFYQKKYESAIFEFNRFLLACTTANLCAEAKFWIAESHYKRKKYIKAIEEYNRFIAQKSGESLIRKSYNRIGEIYYIQSRYDEAVILWKKALESTTSRNERNRLIIKIGDALFLNEDYDESVELVKPLLNVREDINVASSARLITGRVYQMKNRHHDAIRLFNAIPDQLLRKKPYYNAHYYKALSALALRNVNSAKSYLEFFLLIGKNSDWYYDAKYELGRILIKENKIAEGAGDLEEVRSMTVKMELRSKAAMELAKIYLERDPKEAIPYLEDSVSLSDPDEQKKALLLLSSVYIDVGKYEDAERLLDLLAQRYPYDSNMEQIRFLLARVYLGKGDAPRAVREFERLRESNPFSRYVPESDYYIAVAMQKEGKRDRAIAMLKKYIARSGGDNLFDAQVVLGELYVKTKDFANARRSIASLLRTYRNRDGVEKDVYRLGKKLYSEDASARTYLQYVVQRYPRSESAGKVLILFGDESFRKGDYGESEKYYRQYLSVPGRENASSVFLYRIISLYRLEKYRDVIRVTDKDDIPPSDDFTKRLIVLWKGKSLYQAGEARKAYEVLSQFRTRDLSDDDLIIVLKSAVAAGDVKRAKRAVRYLKSNRERYAEGLYTLGKFYDNAGDKESAGQYYNRVEREARSTAYALEAMVAWSKIMIDGKQYGSAVQKLTDIKNGSPKLQVKRNALLAEAYFGSNKPAEGLQIIVAHREALKGSPAGKSAFKKALSYYYKQGDAADFRVYAGYLEKYRGTGDYLNYMRGKLDYKLEKFRNSYYYFYKLSHRESPYRDEALYRLGLISLYHQNNEKRAVRYFERLLVERNGKNTYALKTRILLAIQARERGDDETAKMHLARVIGNAENMILRTRAMNLYEHYGFYEHSK
ncbi:MAG TPA: tetratricopeptide repeat protein [Spirochaetota bacterium]|nr:tetratricopeptide repeat protein [Spirochaetota bacterium]